MKKRYYLHVTCVDTKGNTWKGNMVLETDELTENELEKAKRTYVEKCHLLHPKVGLLINSTTITMVVPLDR